MKFVGNLVKQSTRYCSRMCIVSNWLICGNVLFSKIAVVFHKYLNLQSDDRSTACRHTWHYAMYIHPFFIRFLCKQIASKWNWYARNKSMLEKDMNIHMLRIILASGTGYNTLSKTSISTHTTDYTLQHKNWHTG